jgi:muramoyltetrapeptide carboxypeptidase
MDERRASGENPGAPVFRGKLGIFAPGSVPRREPLEAGLSWLDRRGIPYVLGATARPGEGLHAGAPEERAAELNRFLRDPEIGAILCARGGSGTLGILPYVDYDLAAAQRKPVIGMSDVTALHLALYHRSRVRGISGATVAQLRAELPAYTEERWEALVTRPFTPGPVPLPDAAPAEGATAAGARPRSLSPEAASAAEGVLLPCNLSLLAAMIGTPYLPSLKGTILVLEDIHETPQSLDRIVTQLTLSGLAREPVGVILGQFTECLPRGAGVTEEEGLALLRDWARSLGVPALAGFPYGHEALSCALPFATRARLRVSPPALELLADPWPTASSTAVSGPRATPPRSASGPEARS